MLRSEIIWKEVHETKAIHPEWRMGQLVFNVTFDLYPETANVLRGSPIDCFHNNDNVEHFLRVVDLLGN
jgi:hypothetical protein